MYGRILVALQEKETDNLLVAHVRALARQIQAEVILLRVITVSDDDGDGLGVQFQVEIGSSGWRRMSQAKAVMPELERQLREAGVCVETALVVSTQSEADAIVRHAAENDCDLIAVASDSRPWYKRLIGGSTTDGVMRKATVPTLFVGDGAREAPQSRSTPEGNRMMEIFGSANL